MKRFQECNILVKLWRLRHYVYIPFRWLRWKLTPDKSGEFNSKTIWHIYVGTAQCDMNWVYTSEEVNEFIKKRKDDKK